MGLQTPHHLNVTSDDPVKREFAEIIKRDHIDKGHLGVASGKGFYDYES